MTRKITQKVSIILTWVWLCMVIRTTGLGRGYFSPGDISRTKGKNEKALGSFEKAGQTVGQGNVCPSLAQIAASDGETETAILIERLADNDFDPNLPPLDRDSLNSEAMNISIELYGLLIKPVELKINNKSELIIIPDGGLNILPMEILYSGKNFLLENYSIKYYQSATLLNLMSTILKKEHKSKGFGGFGDPVYDQGNYEKGEEERGIKIAQRGESKYYILITSREILTEPVSLSQDSPEREKK